MSESQPEGPASSEAGWKRDFILAGVLFVVMALLGTIFSIWFVATQMPTNKAPSIVDPRR